MGDAQKHISAIFLLVLVSGLVPSSHGHKIRHQHRPCKEMVFYFHDILYNGKNFDNKISTTFAGADPIMVKTRDVSVIGGTGDFFMARGIATISTDAFEGAVYFRLRIHVKLYECWK